MIARSAGDKCLCRRSQHAVYVAQGKSVMRGQFLYSQSFCRQIYYYFPPNTLYLGGGYLGNGGKTSAYTCDNVSVHAWEIPHAPIEAQAYTHKEHGVDIRCMDRPHEYDGFPTSRNLILDRYAAGRLVT